MKLIRGIKARQKRNFLGYTDQIGIGNVTIWIINIKFGTEYLKKTQKLIKLQE